MVFGGKLILGIVFRNVVMESFDRRKCIESDFLEVVVVVDKEMDCMSYVTVIVVDTIVMILDVM